jgi:hypothetical protein
VEGFEHDRVSASPCIVNLQIVLFSCFFSDVSWYVNFSVFRIIVK